jgi:hypothetical protein
MITSNESRKLDTSAMEEGQYYCTLGKGKKAKCFWARIMDDGIHIRTGENMNSAEFLSSTQIKNCLLAFKNSEWFPLGNNITNIEVGGLGECFKNVLHKSPKYASHFAAIWVNQGLLDYRYGDRSRVELKVL